MIKRPSSSELPDYSQLDRLLLGLSEEHLCDQGDYAGILHKEVVTPFMELVEKAANAGFDLKIASGFRSFERQCHIWNRKASGQLRVLDDQDNPVDILALDDIERIHAIMRFSALPGASRHHWGTDIDVYDANAVSPDYSVQLSLSETRDSGPFAPLHRWLDQILPTTDFYRPYDRDTGGVAVEPWHLSYRPLATIYQKTWRPELVQAPYAQIGLALSDCIQSNMRQLTNRYVHNLGSGEVDAS